MDATNQYSHPDEPIRHSYPLAIESAGLGTAVGLLRRTLPYALMRFAILFTVTVVTIIWGCTTFGGAAFLGQKLHPWVGSAWMFGGMGLYGYVWRFILRYTLYLIKCGHIAVLTELMTENDVKNGSESMFSYGKRIVTERFGQVNVLFGLDVLNHGVVRAFNRSLDFIGGLLPIPGLKNLMAVIQAIVYAATTFIDETIFSYILARGDENPWRSSRDGLVYYGQNAKEILKTAVGVVVLDKVLTLVAWGIMLLPAAAVTAVLPASVKGGGGLAAFFVACLFAMNIRSAFLQPLFLIMVMTKFHVSVRNQEINMEWDAKLDSISSKYRSIKEGISTWKPLQGATDTQASDLSAPTTSTPT